MHVRELKALKNFTHVLSKARQEGLCPLDTDLLMEVARYRTSGFPAAPSTSVGHKWNMDTRYSA
jgi:hypothetical protein